MSNQKREDYNKNREKDLEVKLLILVD